MCIPSHTAFFIVSGIYITAGIEIYRKASILAYYLKDYVASSDNAYSWNADNNSPWLATSRCITIRETWPECMGSGTTFEPSGAGYLHCHRHLACERSCDVFDDGFSQVPILVGRNMFHDSCGVLCAVRL